MSRKSAHIALLFAAAGWQQTASEPNGTAISADLLPTDLRQACLCCICP